MTIVAAVTDGRTVWMGADSAGTCNGLLISKDKIARYTAGGADYLFGSSGDSVLLTAMRHAGDEYRPDPTNPSECDDWAQNLAETWTKTCCELPYQPVQDGTMPGQGLLAYAGRLWRLGANIAIPVEGRFAAIGFGEDYAYGAFEVLTRTKAFHGSPQNALELAVGAALAWSSHCHPPARYETLQYPD